LAESDTTSGEIHSPRLKGRMLHGEQDPRRSFYHFRKFSPGRVRRRSFPPERGEENSLLDRRESNEGFGHSGVVFYLVLIIRGGAGEGVRQFLVKGKNVQRSSLRGGVGVYLEKGREEGNPVLGTSFGLGQRRFFRTVSLCFEGNGLILKHMPKEQQKTDRPIKYVGRACISVGTMGGHRRASCPWTTQR